MTQRSPFRQWLAKKARSLFQGARRRLYALMSDGVAAEDGAIRNQPVLITGSGRVVLKRCRLGIWPSPFYFSGYIHLETRSPEAEIEIGDDVRINNNAVFIAEKSRIRIGRGCLIGSEFTVYDSDFHGLDPAARHGGGHPTAPVSIGENVFIGSRVTVLKGVEIGDNCVIASGSVVSRSIPANSIAGGVPARIIGEV